MAVEVGARGVVGQSLKKAAATIGMRGRAQNMLIAGEGCAKFKEACHCSRWLYLLSGKRGWEYGDAS
jgi:hypothetical protein